MSFKIAEWTKAANIYEVNIRQYTKEGTLKAFVPHINRLKNMGVSIVWLMPIFPVGQVNRKGTLGSAYSIRDYKTVNPDYGTIDDLKIVVDQIHKAGMHVVLDWVANHTAWDHEWITSHPEYYERDQWGNIKAPNADWTDTAHLNYGNPATREAMIDALKFWVEKLDIDGYRCDMAGLVPVDFWIQARTEIEKKKKDLFWLAEWEDPQIHQAFDMSYSWNLQALMAKITRREQNVYDLDHYRSAEIWNYPNSEYRMVFTSNHDENSWHGSEYQRYGNGAKTYAVLSYCLPAMPLIYSGQESALNRSLPFFEKDCIEWGDYPLEDFYKKLNGLKKDNPALWNGKFGGSFSKIFTSDNSRAYVFARIKDKNKVIAFFNLSHEQTEFKAENQLLEGKYTDFLTNEEKKFSTLENFTLKPWEYKIFVAK